jgi:hypothetical protein
MKLAPAAPANGDSGARTAERPTPPHGRSTFSCGHRQNRYRSRTDRFTASKTEHGALTWRADFVGRCRPSVTTSATRRPLSRALWIEPPRPTRSRSRENHHRGVGPVRRDLRPPLEPSNHLDTERQHGPTAGGSPFETLNAFTKRRENRRQCGDTHVLSTTLLSDGTFPFCSFCVIESIAPRRTRTSVGDGRRGECVALSGRHG